MPIQPYHLAMVTTLVAYELFIMFVLSFCVCSGDVFICSPFLHFPLYRNGVYLFCFLCFHLSMLNLLWLVDMAMMILS